MKQQAHISSIQPSGEAVHLRNRMTAAEEEIVSYLKCIQPSKIGLMKVRTDEPKFAAVIAELDARYRLFTPECIFDDCTDEQAKSFLESFIQGLSINWELSIELCKLLSRRGHLVAGTVEPLLASVDWINFTFNRQLLLSYLAVRKEGDTLAERLLDQVREDFRDGLLLACYRIESEMLDRKLMKKFLQWEAQDWSAGSTGELYALEQFIAKWLEDYPYAELEPVVRLYFKHCGN
jgi:hypothetical protein